MRRGRADLFGAAEFATLVGVGQAADALMVDVARRLAKRFPLLDRGAPCFFVFPFLGEVARRHIAIGCGAYPAEELAVGAALDDVPSLGRDGRGKNGEGGNRVKKFLVDALR